MKKDNNVRFVFYKIIQSAEQISRNSRANFNIDGLAQGYSNSCMLAMELLQSYTKPSI